MNTLSEIYLIITAIFIVSFSNATEDFSVEIEGFSIEAGEF